MPCCVTPIRRHCLVLALIAGFMSSQLSLVQSGSAASRRLCVHSLQLCTDCSEEPVEAACQDDCCAADSGANPVESQSQDDCGCCVLIAVAVSCLSDAPDRLLLLTMLRIEDIPKPDVCHAHAWVDSLLRPPSI